MNKKQIFRELCAVSGHKYSDWVKEYHMVGDIVEGQESISNSNYIEWTRTCNCCGYRETSKTKPVDLRINDGEILMLDKNEMCENNQHTFGEWRFRCWTSEKDNPVRVCDGELAIGGVTPTTEIIYGKTYYRKCKYCDYVEITNDKTEEINDCLASKNPSLEEEIINYFSWLMEDIDLVITPTDRLYQDVEETLRKGRK